MISESAIFLCMDFFRHFSPEGRFFLWCFFARRANFFEGHFKKFLHVEEKVLITCFPKNHGCHETFNPKKPISTPVPLCTMGRNAKKSLLSKSLKIVILQLSKYKNKYLCDFEGAKNEFLHDFSKSDIENF